jgi:two-component system response regulator YesN
MNLLVVDDEPIIRLGLRTLVEWEKHGLNFIGEASDGQEALEMIRSVDVDILVTDIRMPRMDGLELIRRTREIKESIGILVLSCLDDFAFVKEAMKLGAYDYILKPTMEPEELLSILKNMGDKLLQDRVAKEQIHLWQAELEQSKSFQNAAKIRHYLDNDVYDAKLDEDLFMKGNGLYSLCICWSPSLRMSFGEWQFTDAAASVRLTDNSLLLIYPFESAGSKYEQHHQSFLRAKDIERHLYKELADETRWLICIGPMMSKLIDLKNNLQIHARQLQHYYFNYSKETVIWDDCPEMFAEAPFPYEHRNDLLRAISHNNADGIVYHAEQIGLSLKASKPPVAKIHAFIFELMGLAVGYAREEGYAHIDDFEQQYVSLEKIQSCFQIDVLTEWLAEAMRELWNCRWGTTLHTISSNVFIRKAMEFMKTNYNKNIATVDIADHVKLSRSYLSDLYSREMGESLIETLTRIRIAEAKKKLRSGEMKVYEVAESVGFSDPRSFAKTFKRIVGCTPKEYDSQNK